MKLCPSCQGTYPDDAERCDRDGQWLIDPASSRDPADGYLGQVLAGRYRIHAKLGAGSVGAVFRADDLQAGGAVAVKILMPGAGYNEPRAARRLRREARAASGLDHPNIVRVLDYGEADGVPFLVMELVEGEELGDLLMREGALDPHRAVHLADQVAASLAHAHARGVVHRDLKPENIFLTRRDGRPDFVKVLDFGLVKLIDMEGGLEPTRITEANLVLGTPHYMAPEQITGGRVGPQTDLYALGVLLYRLTVGQVPFESDNVIVVMQAHVREAPVRPGVVQPGYPPALEALVLSLLEKDPRHRPQSAQEVQARLRSPEIRHAVAHWAPAGRASQRSMPAIGVVTPDRDAPTGRQSSEPKAPPQAPRRRDLDPASRPLSPAYAPAGPRTPAVFWWMVAAAWVAALGTLITTFLILRS